MEFIDLLVIFFGRRIAVILALAMIIIAKTPLFDRINAEKLRKFAKIAVYCGILPGFSVIAVAFMVLMSAPFGGGRLGGLEWVLYAYAWILLQLAFGVLVWAVPLIVAFAWLDKKIRRREGLDWKFLHLAILVYSVIFAGLSAFAAFIGLFT